jgi:Domain of unknown function (DUF4386)
MVMKNRASGQASVRLSAALLLVGQLLYIVITQFHADGVANDHPAVFAEYAGSGIWTAVHVGQFVATAILLAGLLALFFVLDLENGPAMWTGRFAAALTAVTLALYGVVMAVDGVALKQAVNAWVGAPDAEKAARFASAEAVRWIEWGARSYENFALGLALLLFAATVVRTAWVPRPIAYLMGLSGLTYLFQGWVAGADGFTRTHDIAIVASWVVNLAWMIWLVVLAWRAHELEPAALGDSGRGRRDV